MSDLFPRVTFTTFGPTRFLPASAPFPTRIVQSPRTAGLRKQVRTHVPRRSGVYGMIDGNGDLIYVGKAKDLRARLLSYFRARSRDPKAGHIVRQAAAIAWEVVPSEFAALLRELELIRRWQPRCNVHGRPGRRRYAYVCLGRRPAPYAFVAPRPPRGAVAFYGPVPAGKHVREAVRVLNDWFGLRDCPRRQEMVFADQGELFAEVRAAGCIRHEIGTCLGPCAALCTQAAYAAQVQRARIFLDGDDDTPLTALERDMLAASEALAFERAGSLRDRLESLRWLRERIDRLRLARRRHSFIYPVADVEGRTLWYLIHDGRVAAVLPRPSDSASSRTARETLCSLYRKDVRTPSVLTPAEIDGVWLVAAWFRRHATERARTLSPRRALAACR